MLWHIDGEVVIDLEEVLEGEAVVVEDEVTEEDCIAGGSVAECEVRICLCCAISRICEFQTE